MDSILAAFYGLSGVLLVLRLCFAVVLFVLIDWLLAMASEWRAEHNLAPISFIVRTLLALASAVLLALS